MKTITKPIVMTTAADGESFPDSKILVLSIGAKAIIDTLHALPSEFGDEDRENLWLVRDWFEDQIDAIPAKTPAGIAAKLKIAYRNATDNIGDQDGPTEETDCLPRTLWAIMKGAEALAAGGVALDPDAEVLGLAAAWHAAEDRAGAPGATDDDIDTSPCLEALSNAHSVGLAGLAAKMKVLLRYRGDDEIGNLEGDLIRSIARDIDRLAPGSVIYRPETGDQDDIEGRSAA